MIRNNNNPGSDCMTVGISVFNLMTGDDFRYVNRLIESLGASKSSSTFIVIGKREQKDYLIPAPKNFQYRLHELRVPISTPDNPEIDRILGDALVEFNCDLFVEFGPGGNHNFPLPRVTMINSFRMFGIDNLKTKSPSSRRKLKLISKASSSSAKNPQGIVFSSPYLHDEFCRIVPTDRIKTTSIYVGGSISAEKNRSKILSRYGIESRYFLSPVYSDGIRETLKTLKAYGRAFENNTDVPEMVLVSFDESPRDTSVILDAIDKSQLHSKIKYIGTIPEEDFSTILQKADILVFPFEVFFDAETLVTAMNCGCAILCANLKATQEIADRAALYFDPDNWGDLTLKMKLIADDKDLLSFLRGQSGIRAAVFSKEQITDRLLDFFHDVVREYDDFKGSKTSELTATK